MSTWLPRQQTLLVAMVMYLGAWGVHAWSHDAATHYHKKHLKGSLGLLVPGGAARSDDGELRIEDTGGNVEIKLVEEGEEEKLIDGPPAVQFRSVPVEYFRVMVDRAETYHDVLRVFLGEEFSDDEIDRIMTKARHHDRTSLNGGHFREITREDFEKWEATRQDTRKYGQCARPVQELVRIRDLTERADVEYQPDCVVRYRCRPDSGCCGHGLTCTAKTSVNITKSIMVGQLSTERDRTSVVTNLSVQHFQVQNDTSCACRPIQEYTLRPCPYPFDYSLDLCQCRSRELGDYCRRISNGNAKLAQRDVECILEGQCRPLDKSVCEHFNVREGRCLKSRELRPDVRDEG